MEIAKSIALGLKNAPDINAVFIKRFKNYKKISKLLDRSDGDAVVMLLQLLADLISKETIVTQTKANCAVGEFLNVQSDRIEKLAQEISNTMFSSRQLLSSPLSDKFN